MDTILKHKEIDDIKDEMILSGVINETAKVLKYVNSTLVYVFLDGQFYYELDIEADGEFYFEETFEKLVESKKVYYMCFKKYLLLDDDSDPVNLYCRVYDVNAKISLN